MPTMSASLPPEPDPPDEGFDIAASCKPPVDAKAPPEPQESEVELSDSDYHLGIAYPKTAEKFHVGSIVKRVLQLLWQADKHLVIRPYDPTLPLLSDSVHFPSKENFNKVFHHFDAKQVNDKARLVVVLRLSTSIPVNNVKFDTTNGLMNYLQEHHIKMYPTTFGTSQTAHIGYVLGYHPRTTWRPTVKHELEKAMQAVPMSEADIQALLEDGTQLVLSPDGKVALPKFEIRKEHIGYGNGNNRVSTQGLAMTCEKQYVNLMREIVQQVAVTNVALPEATFLFPGMAKEIGESKYKNLLAKQQKLIDDTLSIRICGLTDKALDYPIKVKASDHATSETVPLMTILTRLDFVLSIEPTSEQENGIWLCVIERSKIEEAKRWIDNSLSAIFQKYIPINPNAGTRIADEPYPRRAYRPKYSTSGLSYAAMLSEKTADFVVKTPTNDRKPSSTKTDSYKSKSVKSPNRRGRFRKPMIEYGDADFPPPTKKTKQNRSTSPGTHTTSASSYASSASYAADTRTTSTLTVKPLESNNLEDLEAAIMAKLTVTISKSVATATKQALAPTTQKLAELSTAHAQLNRNQTQLNTEIKTLRSIITSIGDKLGIPPINEGDDEDDDENTSKEPSKHRGNSNNNNNNNINGRPFNDDKGAEH